MINSIKNQAVNSNVSSDNAMKKSNEVSRRIQALVSNSVDNVVKEPKLAGSSNTISQAERSQLDKFVEEANKTMNSANIERYFEIDKDLNRPIIKLIDKESKEVVLQIPSEVAVKISKNIGEMLGLLTDRTI